MNLGDLATVEQGEVRLITLNFAARLQPSETLTSPASASMAPWRHSAVPDANAANLVLGAPAISGSNVAVLCGGFGTAGFQAGAVYSLSAAVATSLGQTLISGGQITCNAPAPSTQSSGGGLPDATVPLTADATASVSAIYVFTTPGLTLSLPTNWARNGGIVTAADVGGVGGTVAGDVLNWSAGTTSLPLIPGAAMSFQFSPELSGWFSI